MLKVPAGHLLASYIDARCRALNRVRPEDDWRTRRLTFSRFLRGNRPGAIDWGEAGGPLGLRRAAEQLGFAHLAPPYTFFYPVHWMHAGSLFDRTLGDERAFFADTHPVHLWNSHLHKIGFGPDGPFRRGSLVARRLDEHGI